jgi:DNA-directed RNA polymerase subunit RPC12/RpoP
MIHFRCPLCHHTLKVSRKQAGSALMCPRCGETVAVPAREAADTGAESVTQSRSAGGQFAGLFLEPSPWRWLAVGVASVATLSLVMAALASALHPSGSVASTARWTAMVTTLPCLLILFLLLYGRGTSCPTCGRWWARTGGSTECLGREEFAKDGALWVRARRRISYACRHCGRAWSEAYTDEYPGAVARPGARRAM